MPPGVKEPRLETALSDARAGRRYGELLLNDWEVSADKPNYHCASSS
jgi:hypothetical protein